MLAERILILGGTRDARELAAMLTGRGHAVITSLAGVTQSPELPAGEHRTGGFGGVDGMTKFIAADAISVVVDATHPFAARISAHAEMVLDWTAPAHVAKAAVGTENLQALAGKVGMQVHTVLPLLTQFLPQIIDKLTPQGHIHENNPSGSQIQNVLTSVISSGLGGLFGG